MQTVLRPPALYESDRWAMNKETQNQWKSGKEIYYIEKLEERKWKKAGERGHIENYTTCKR